MFNGKRLKELRTSMGLTQKELRTSMGLTQKELGDLVNVTKVSICCYEKNNRTPNIETLMDLAHILNTTPNYLLDSEINALVKEDETEYSVAISKDDLDIINEIKKYPNLYTIMKNNPKKIISNINKKFN